MINYEVKRIPSKVGKEYIKRNHYTGGIHNGPICYGLYDGCRLIGVIAFACPCSENVRASIFGVGCKSHVIELHRLFVEDGTPKNTESYFISRALKLLKTDKPHIYGVVSFADSTQGHVGVIYQACNAIYYGVSGSTTFYVDGDGRLRHPRQNGVNITKSQAEMNGWTAVKRNGKHRYLFLLPDRKMRRKDLMRLLCVDIAEYPKRSVEN